MKKDYPKVLYHYCSTESFIRIVESKSIWLCAHNTMNDFHEGERHGRLIKEIAKKYITDGNKKIINDFLNCYHINRPNDFFFSLSEESDLLSQWRGYGDDGAGVSIGFNMEYFDLERFIPFRNSSLKDNLGIYQIEYETEDALAHQSKQITEVIEEITSKNYTTEEDRQKDIIMDACLLRQYAKSIKNVAFIEEKEWRIAHSPHLGFKNDGTLDLVMEGATSEMKFRTSKNQIVPYFEYSFSEKKDVLPITKVTLGPKHPFNHDNLSYLLAKHGYATANRAASKATYR